MTAADAAQRAGEVLEDAGLEPNPQMAGAKAGIADSWLRLAELLHEMERV